MRNALLTLGALVALTVLGSGAWLVLCGSAGHAAPSPYSPFEIRIDSVEARGQLNVEEQEELFLLNKENELILVIPKEDFDGVWGFRSRKKPHVRSIIENTMELRSNNPNVLLCQLKGKGYECNTEITTNQPRSVGIKGQDLWVLAKSAGFLDRMAVETLLNFELDGIIAGEQFLIKGRMIFDSTQRYFANKARSRTIACNQALRGGILFASALILVAIIWLVIRFKRSKR